MQNQILEDTFRCPLCEANLKFSTEATTCEECGYVTFQVAEIPWLFKDPKSTLAEWQNRFNHYTQNLAREISALDADLTESHLLNSTRQRIRNLRKAKSKYSKNLKELMRPLQITEETPKELFAALKTVLPMSQRLMSYESNVFRDWGWGDEENKIYADMVEGCMRQAQVDLEKIVVVGAGACRLAFDLHRAMAVKNTIAVDINPFLFLVAKKVIEGDVVPLVDFPLAPIDGSCQFVDLDLKADKANQEGFHFVFMDALNLNLKTAGSRSIITPWFIDIIPQDIDIFIRQLNRSLAIGGKWVNFGTYVFHHADKSICYSKEEMLEVVGECGFKIVDLQEKEVPYLNSPYSCQSRREKVIVFAAEKIAEVDEFEDYDYLPDWITDTSLSVPAKDVFKSYVFVNQIQFEVLRAINGQISIDAIAQAVGGKYKMQKDQAIQAVRNFFTKIYEENLFQGL